MAAQTFVVSIRTSASTPAGARVTGLSPVFSLYKRLSDNTDVSAPAITEVGRGLYKFSWDARASGEIAFQIDAGSSLTTDYDRYLDGVLSDSKVWMAADGMDTLTLPTDLSNMTDALSSLPKMMLLLVMRFFNKVDQTSSQQTVHNNADQVLGTMDTSDNGATATKGKAQ